MLHPFQCIVTLKGRYFVAACGPKLTSVDLETGELMCEWPSNQGLSTTTTTTTAESSSKAEDSEQPPSKKQKTESLDKEDEVQTSAKKQKTASPAKTPIVIKLAVSPDETHLVAITEDKCVHVFEHSQGQLHELSQRVMPKRPCAVQILPDNATILVADKFGDVYAIPLIPTAADSGDANARAEDSSTQPQPEPQFKPSADLTTIHSQRNRQVLEAQMKQKIFTKKKDPLKFEHKVLIGHVSMLTDMRYMVTPSPPHRGHIVTADRDEHIRISRGPPQSHVIESFCLGHTEFVSKICEVDPGSGILVSGGGDDWLGVWNWPDSKLLWRQNIKDIPRNPPEKVAVSGMWATSVATSDGTRKPVVVVALERVNSLILLGVLSSLTDQYGNKVPAFSIASIELTHAPIDVVSIHDDYLIVSVDSRDGEGRVALLTMRMHVDEGKLHIVNCKRDEGPLTRAIHVTSQHGQIEADAKDVDALLYATSNLRKRRDLPDGEANGDEQDESTLEPEAANE